MLPGGCWPQYTDMVGCSMSMSSRGLDVSEESGGERLVQWNAGAGVITHEPSDENDTPSMSQLLLCDGD